MIKNKRINLAILTALISVGSFFIGYNAYALEVGQFMANAFGSIFQFLVWILGGILYVLIYLLIQVAQYNGFIHSAAVSNGWTIVRDLANMFFIVILLIIAFATILRREEYSYKKLLPKLLIMAVLINFSKLICGIFIDVAQVIMLTFVNGFKSIGGANLTDMLGISETMKIAKNDLNTTVNALSIVGTYVLAFLYVLISVVVILAMLAMLVMRMIMLWVYIVLSPLAFLLAAFPAGQKYSGQWWGEFSKNVVIGPVLAFFIWLSFVSIPVNSTGSQALGGISTTGGDKDTTQISGTTVPQAGLAQAGSPDSMVKFIISIGMLLGGLMVSQQIGGMAGGIAGRGMAAIQRGQHLLTSIPGRAGRAAVTAGATYMAGGGDNSVRANIRSGIGAIAGSRVAGANNLALNTLTAMNATRNQTQQRAQARAQAIAGTHDRRIMRRFINQTAISPENQIVRDTLEQMAPTMARGGNVAGSLRDAARDGRMPNIGRNEWERIGEMIQSGTYNLFDPANNAVLDHIQANANVRGHVNRGAARAGGRVDMTDQGGGIRGTYGGVNIGGNQLLGRTADGVDHTIDSLRDAMGRARYGNTFDAADVAHVNNIANTLERNSAQRGVVNLNNPGAVGTMTTAGMGNANINYYLKEKEYDKPMRRENTSRIVKSGDISINRFAREQDNTVAVDFNKLPRDVFQDAGVDVAKIRGVNISDKAKIRSISSAMSDAIAEKIATGENNGKQLELLKKAQIKFESLANGHTDIENMSLINSGSESYKNKTKRAETKIHEEIHGFGAKDTFDVQRAEDYVDKNTDFIVQNKLYSKRQDVGRGYKSLGTTMPTSDDRNYYDAADVQEHSTGQSAETNRLIDALQSLSRDVKKNSTGINKFDLDIKAGASNLESAMRLNTRETYANIKTIKNAKEATQVAAKTIKKTAEMPDKV